jgi:hypothetical protein
LRRGSSSPETVGEGSAEGAGRVLEGSGEGGGTVFRVRRRASGWFGEGAPEGPATVGEGSGEGASEGRRGVAEGVETGVPRGSESERIARKAREA